MIAGLLDAASRYLALAGVIFAGVVALTHWAVRHRTLQPFGAWPRLVRRISDPVLRPLEQRLLRAGGNPQSAPLWLLAASVVFGLVLIALVRWLIGMTYTLAYLAGSGPVVWLRVLVNWGFGLVMLAIVVRVIGSWFGANPWSKVMRLAAALTDWIIEPIRRILPPFGPFDLSPMVAYFVLLLARGLVLSAL
ncbi:MAG: YggT family protein [Gemmatimonadota bacterium]